MRHVRFNILHIRTAPLMAASVGVPTNDIHHAAIRRSGGAQASLDWKANWHEDGLRRGIQRVGVCFQTGDDNVGRSHESVGRKGVLARRTRWSKLVASRLV
jgi:hypothetical protein